MRLDGEQWRHAFDSYEREAFRLETLPLYAMHGEEEEFRSFMATGHLDLPEDDPWLIRVREFRASGRSLRRVHLVTQPLSDYLRYEFAAYAYNIEAGEEIRIFDVTNGHNPLAGVQDFWMFDDARVVLMHYRSDGTHTGRELLESADLDQYRHWKEIALSHSVPFAEYVTA